MRRSEVSVMAAALLLLAGCEEEAPAPVSSETGGEAVGEIMGGSISDDMIPLEELTSTSPPAEPTASERAAASRGQGSQGARPAPEEPVTAGPSQPVPETPEAEPPADDPAP